MPTVFILNEAVGIWREIEGLSLEVPCTALPPQLPASGTVLGEDQDTVVTSEPCLLPLQDVCPRDGGAGGGDRPFAHRHEGTQVSPSDSARFLRAQHAALRPPCLGKVV